MNTPLFSIITPTYNCATKIAATATSVFAQDQSLYEYLVIDGGSSDGTVDYLRAQGSALRWSSEPDGGIYDAMNKGIRLARGEYLYFLGAGDHLRPGALQAIAKKLANLSRSLTSKDQQLFLYGDVYWTELDLVWAGAFDRCKIAIKNICHQAIFFQHGIFQRLGEYDMRLRYCADHAFNIRCFGEPWIEKIYLDLIIADYEGAGVSATQVDTEFRRAWPGLVRRHLGWEAWLRRGWFFFSQPLHPRRVAQTLRYWVRCVIRTIFPPVGR